MSIRDKVGQYVRSKNLRARPSKTYLHRMFDEDVATYSRCQRAADVAAADFKNANLFESEVYYGVDVDENGLRRGLESVGQDGVTFFAKGPVDGDSMSRHAEPSSDVYVAVLGDMRNPLFPVDSLDLIASTHTFNHVPPTDHPTVVEHFCDALRPGGTLLLQLAETAWYEGELERLMTRNFESVETRRYRKLISATYERLVADDDGAVVFPRENTLRHFLMVLASATLLQFEKPGALGGDSVYVRCLGRR